MAKNISPLDNKEVAGRLRLLRRAISGENQALFAAKVGIEYKRWNNFENDYPLPRDMAIALVRKIPGLSLDWIYLGRTETLAFPLQRELETAGKATTSPAAAGKGA